MVQLLDYSPRDGRIRRRRVLFTLTVVIASVSSIFAVPQFKAFQQRQNRRVEIRAQFIAQLASAERALEDRKIENAATALVRAEFPTHVESRLFWRSELNSFERRADRIRQRIGEIYPLIQREHEAKAKAEREREEAISKSRTGLEVEHVCIIRCTRSASDLFEALKKRAIEQMKNGNMRQAQAICEQIAELDPVYRFDTQFWENAP